MEINGAAAVIKLLEDHEVEYVFGYPGGANLPLYDALYKSKSIKHILARNEQGAAFMASGYARIKNKAGVCFATSGPGVTNIVTGLADAYLDSIPIVAITGQIPRVFIGTDAFQEVDTFNITSPITKHNELINDINELIPAVKAAFYLAETGRRGPVLIDIPRDVQETEADFNFDTSRQLTGYQPTLHAHIGQIKRTLRAIKKAQTPLIIAGGGVMTSGAQNTLKNFAEALQIPVVRTLMGKGVLDENHPLFIGMIGTHGNAEGNKAVNQADLLIVIGSRLGDRTTMYKRQYFARDAAVVHIDIDPAEIGKTIPVDVPVVGDVNETLINLLKEIKESKLRSDSKNWFIKKNNNNILWKGEHGEVIGMVLAELSNLNLDFHITTDVGRHQMWATHYCNNPRHLPILTSGGLGTMGYGLPAAIGCYLADPSKPVVNISGDGSFFMNMQELFTAVEYKIPVIILIINDQKLGMIQEIQDTKYNKRSIANKFELDHDFVAIAKACGAQGYHITNPSRINSVLQEAINKKEPAIINFDLYRVAQNIDSKLQAV